MAEHEPELVRRNERLSIINGSYAMVGITVVGNFAPLFIVKALHATTAEVGMLSALPALATIIATWAGTWMMGRHAEKKGFCVLSTIAARCFYLVIAGLPLWVHGIALPLLVVIAIALMNVPQALSALSWQSLIGDLIPPRRRAPFFGVRNRVTTVVALLATLIPGIVLQHFAPTLVWPYQVMFALSACFSVFEVLYLIWHKEPKNAAHAAPIHLGVREFATCLRVKPYRVFLLGALIFNLGWQLAWPLFTIYQIRDAGATAAWISAFNVAGQITQIATYRLWGRLSERIGNAPTFAIACVGMAATPMLTILSLNLPYLTAVNFVSGAFSAGVGLIQFNQLLEAAPESERTRYIAHFNVLVSAVGVIAPEIGVALFGIIGMDATMSVSTVVRLIGAGALIGGAWLRLGKRLRRRLGS